jgi:hypothetical protein
VVNERGEKEMDIISVSQALQIAGRAGRYGTQYEKVNFIHLLLLLLLFLHANSWHTKIVSCNIGLMYFVREMFLLVTTGQSHNIQT